MKTPTLARALFCAACFAATPFVASAQDFDGPATRYIDVFQDGSLFITYEEYLERQRRVEAAQAANRTTTAPLVIPTARVPVAVTGASGPETLRSQWQIGAFR